MTGPFVRLDYNTRQAGGFNVGDIVSDTAVKWTDKNFELEFSADWAHYFGMLGGYVVACAVRPALELIGDSMQVRSVHAIFTGTSRPGPATGSAEVIHGGRSLSVVRTAIAQEGRRVIEATTTLAAVSPEAPSFVHIAAPTPERPFETSHPSHSKTDSLWTTSMEGRISIDDLDAWNASAIPEIKEWLRFRSLAGFDANPRLASDLGCLVTSDLLGFIAARQQFDTDRWIAPSVDLSVLFHGKTNSSGMYLCQAFGRSAQSGSLVTEVLACSPDGVPLASAFQTQLFKPWSW